MRSRYAAWTQARLQRRAFCRRLGVKSLPHHSHVRGRIGTRASGAASRASLCTTRRDRAAFASATVSPERSARSRRSRGASGGSESGSSRDACRRDSPTLARVRRGERPDDRGRLDAQRLRIGGCNGGSRSTSSTKALDSERDPIRGRPPSSRGGPPRRAARFAVHGLDLCIGTGSRRVAQPIATLDTFTGPAACASPPR
jgi:hypothetical protein